jgi:copper oxidase (laccase) domain-containing protein
MPGMPVRALAEALAAADAAVAEAVGVLLWTVPANCGGD